MAGFFITATNTARGKTTITAALRLWIEHAGHSCLAMKPVQTGTAQAQTSTAPTRPASQIDSVFGEDLYTIYTAGYAAKHRPTREELSQSLGPLLPLLQPYGYEAACSPHLAAELEGRPCASLVHIKQCARVLQEQYCDVLLVEGAGGLLVPVNRNGQGSLTMLDIAVELALPVILVAQSGLGAINDACLSLHAIQSRNIVLAGFVLNDLEPLPQCSAAAAAVPLAAVIRNDNARMIAELSGAHCLGTMPFAGKQGDAKQLLRLFGTLSGLNTLRAHLPPHRKTRPE